MRTLNRIGLLPCVLLTVGILNASAQSTTPPPPVPTAEEPQTPVANPPSATPAGEAQQIPVSAPPAADDTQGTPVEALPAGESSQDPNHRTVPAPVQALPAAETTPDVNNRAAPGSVQALPPSAAGPDVSLPGGPTPRLGYDKYPGPLTTAEKPNGYLQINTDRVRRILVLRRVLGLGFRSSDIANALPLLRNLRDISGSPNIDPEAAVEAEYQALLAAEPGTALPESSAYKLTDAAEYYRDAQAKIWSSLVRKLGNTKAEGLRALIGQDNSNVRFQYKPTQSLDTSSLGKGHVTFMPGQTTAAPGKATIVTEPEPGKYVLSSQDGKIIAQYDGPLSTAPSYFQRNRFNDNNGIYSQPINVPYNPNTVRMSLPELIQLLEEKLRVMGARSK